MNHLVLTRYLYPKNQVILSFVRAIVARRTDEALYWGFELYWSLFDVYPILQNLCNRYYSHCVGLPEYIRKKGQTWGSTSEKWGPILVEDVRIRDVLAFETVIRNMCSRTAHTTASIAKPDNRPYKLCTVYTAYRYCEPFRIVPPDKSVDRVKLLYEWRMHWLYYASRCERWQRRINAYGGIINHTTKQVDFPDDDALEEFHDEYNLEADEQSPDIIEYILGFRPDTT